MRGQIYETMLSPKINSIDDELFAINFGSKAQESVGSILASSTKP